MVYFIVLADEKIPWRERIIYVGQHGYKEKADNKNTQRKFNRLSDHKIYLKNLHKRQVIKKIDQYRIAFNVPTD